MNEEQKQQQAAQSQAVNSAPEAPTAPAPESAPASAPETPAPEAPETPAPETPEAPEENATPDFGADFRNDYTSKYPDEDLSGDEAYYKHLRGKLDERDGYEKSFDNLSKAVGRSPAFDEMMRAAKEDPEFDPVVWMVSNGKLDLDALQNDESYAGKIAEAQKKSLATKAKQREFEEQGKQNFQPSVDMIKRVNEELGISEEQSQQAIARMYQIMEDLVVNKVDEDTYRMIINGMNFETAVNDARSQGEESGYAKGLTKKVDDKLRKLNTAPERNSGRQAPRAEQRPADEDKNNMFGL